MAKVIGISDERHAAIFGPRDDSMEEKGGTKRLCKVCGGWHRTDQPVPHNCRPQLRQMQHLPAPRVISDIEPHVHDGVLIDSRNKQRDFMKERGLVEFEHFEETAGTHKQDFDSKEYEKDLVQDIKRALEEDPLNRPPPMMIEEANSHVTEEEAVSTEGMEVVGDDTAGS